jgi:Rps23 Pro-64 3,4-dihydroxylase Tpa1-like proline 4-hydroxylase
MKYEIFKDPFVHIIIDDFVPWVYNLQIINEACRLIPGMITSKVNSNQGIVVNSKSKSSKNLWLFQHYATRPNNFQISTYLESQIWSDEVKKILLEAGDSLFTNLLYTDTSQMLMSKYANGDHYSWHRDYNPTATMNYMFAKDKSKFTGGDFVFGDWNSKQPFKTVEFKNNRLIIFPSRVFHSVTPVIKHSDNPIYDRFTIQYWSKLKDIRET